MDGLLAVADQEQPIGGVADQGVQQPHPDKGEVLDLVDDHRGVAGPVRGPLHLRQGEGATPPRRLPRGQVPPMRS